MNDALAAALLGIVQGLTEFLPVSSTGHLALAEKLLKLDPARFGLSFDVALHLGTLLAVVVYFQKVWVDLLRDILRLRLGLLILLIIATIPAGLAGLALGDVVEGPLREPVAIAAALIAGSVIFILAEFAGPSRGGRERPSGADSFVIGCAQALALIPGLSRSGMTISAGIARGLRRDQAARFSFILSTPAVLAAAAKTFYDARKADDLLAHPDALAIGFVCSFVFGLAAIWILVRFLRGHSLLWFVPYRVALAGLIVYLVFTGAL